MLHRASEFDGFFGKTKATENRRDYLEDLHVDGKTTLEWILGIYGGKLWAGWV